MPKKTVSSSFASYLNKPQQTVVEKANGILVVHAGAGSGKTRVITARIASLLKEHAADPSTIIALTFTNKAAREMKERVHTLTDTKYDLPFVGTFHSYCLRLLRTYNHLIDTPHFSILDDYDQQKLIKTIIQKHAVQKRISPRQLAGQISHIKNNALEGTIDFDTINDVLLRELMLLYETQKKASRCFDFDDLLLQTLRLFKVHKQFKKDHQQEVQHILVDEFQDTNHVQHELLKEMIFSSPKKCAITSLCVVGDEDQSIYSWRGAVAGSMVTFKDQFKKVHSVNLEQSYRSIQPILDIANNIIEHNTLRTPKKLWSDKKGRNRIRLLSCVSGHQEAETIALFARQYATQKQALSQCAVLYRSHYQSRTIEEALVRHSIPYVIVGGLQFYDRQEIKDLLAYLKLMVNPFDRISWLRAINTPSRGLGEKFQERFLLEWDQNPFLNFKELALKCISGIYTKGTNTANGWVTGLKKESLSTFISWFNRLAAETSPTKTLKELISLIGYIPYLKNTCEPEEFDERQKNVEELVDAIQAREEKGTTSIAGFLEEVALMQEAKNLKKNDKNCIRLMTLHGAKGLEFDTVIIPGLEEGVLPSGHSIAHNEAVEEERRLLYVGITRAQERLILTHARYRYTHGSLNEQREARFCKELNNSPHIVREDISHWPAPYITAYMRQWLTGAPPPAPLKTFDEEDTPKKPSRHTPLSTKRTKKQAWRRKQRVRHNYFGFGIIESIEPKGGNHTYLTIKFPNGTKKINALFVHPAD